MNTESIADRISWRGDRPATTVAQGGGWIAVAWEIPARAPFATTCALHLPAMENPFWCIPGLFWGDNQQDTTGQYYPRFAPQANPPRRFESSFWELDVHRMAQPLVAVRDGTVWWVLEVAPQAWLEGQAVACSVGFEYTEGVPCLVASLPGNERPYRPVGHDYTMPIHHAGPWPQDGRRNLHWKLRALRLQGNRMEILRLLEENYHRPAPRMDTPPAEAHARATRNALMRWHYHPGMGTFRYTVAFDRVGQQIAEAQGTTLDRHEMPLGWVNGWVVFEALADWALAADDPECFEAITHVWKHVNEAGLESPSGFWWTRHAPQTGRPHSLFNSRLPNGMDGNWMPNPYHIHLRTLGDAVLRAARVLGKCRDRLPFADLLQHQIVSQARLAARLARRGWPLPLSVDSQTGSPTGLQGTASMIWLSVWCELARQGLWDDRTLIREGADFHRSAVESGQLYGAPEDVGSCVTSEDTYIAFDVYLNAFKILGCKEDLETCKRAAAWLYFWRKSFDHVFDPRTLIGAYGLKARGGDLASFKNNHLHIYGLDIDMGLRELSELDRNPLWAALADDHWSFSAQLTPLVDGQFNAYEGMVTEQFYFIDWSALGNSVRLFEPDERAATYDVGPHYRNHGNLAGFSHAWCTAFVLRAALARMPVLQKRL